jgi:Subtilase family
MDGLMSLTLGVQKAHFMPRSTLLNNNAQVAAGNNDMNACFFSPASSQFALTVGSVDQDDWRSSFSNHGPCIDVFAPGNFISSAWYLDDLSYNTISGTSMAGPHAVSRDEMMERLQNKSVDCSHSFHPTK